MTLFFNQFDLYEKLNGKTFLYKLYQKLNHLNIGKGIKWQQLLSKIFWKVIQNHYKSFPKEYR